MKFAMTWADARGSGRRDLLQAMLHHFRRIHAVKHDFRACSGRRFLPDIPVNSTG
jgi:hypothetical protein